MKVSVNWLKEYVDLPTEDADELDEILNQLGLEVDGWERIEAGFSGVIVARVSLVVICLPELAVFTATPVVAAKSLFLVVFGLTLNTEPNAGHRFAPGLRNVVAAFLAMLKALALRQARTHAFDGILDGCVDLVLHCAVFCESPRHIRGPWLFRGQ